MPRRLRERKITKPDTESRIGELEERLSMEISPGEMVAKEEAMKVLLANGWEIGEIANALDISLDTAKTLRMYILIKELGD